MQDLNGLKIMEINNVTGFFHIHDPVLLDPGFVIYITFISTAQCYCILHFQVLISTFRTMNCFLRVTIENPILFK